MKNIKRAALIYMQAAVRFRRRIRCRGQTLVEYALILAVVSIVAVGILINLGQQVNMVYSAIDSQIARAPSAANSYH